MPKFIDITGQRFNRLEVIERGPNNNKTTRWRCRCDCGNEIIAVAYQLKTGSTKSCGCYGRERIRAASLRHGESGKKRSPLYTTWRGIMIRCHQPTSATYYKYGGRGVVVCERWHTFENFRDDMPDRPMDGYTIERIDNSKGYEPGNCRWATSQEQANNKTTSHFLTYNGMTKTIAQWAPIVGVSMSTINARLRLGWTTEEALSTPTRKHTWHNHAKIT